MRSFAYSDCSELERADSLAGFNRFSLVGIATATLGTILAVSLVPGDPAPSGALFASAFVMTIGIALPPLLVAIRYPKSLFRAEHVVVLSPIYWLLLEILQGNSSMHTIKPETIGKVFVAIGTFIVAVWVGAGGSSWRVPRIVVRSVAREFSPDSLFWFSVAAFVLGMLKFAVPTNFDVIEMFSYVGGGRWDAPWVRGQLGGWDAFADQLQYFGYLLPALSVLVAMRTRWGNPRTLICCGMSLIMTLFLAQSGSRRIIGVISGMALITRALLERRLRTRHLIVGATMIAALLIALEIMVQYRLVGLGALGERRDYEPIIEGTVIRVDANFYSISQVVALIPEQYPHTYFDYLLYVIVRPIPRMLWPGKPVDPGFDLASALGFRDVLFSITVVGELYMAAGFFAIMLGGWFYGRVCGMANRLLTEHSTYESVLLYGVLTMALFTGVRSMVELVLMNYALLAWVGLTRLFSALLGEKLYQSLSR